MDDDKAAWTQYESKLEKRIDLARARKEAARERRDADQLLRMRERDPTVPISDLRSMMGDDFNGGRIASGSDSLYTSVSEEEGVQDGLDAAKRRQARRRRAERNRKGRERNGNREKGAVSNSNPRAVLGPTLSARKRGKGGSLQYNMDHNDLAQEHKSKGFYVDMVFEELYMEEDAEARGEYDEKVARRQGLINNLISGESDSKHVAACAFITLRQCAMPGRVFDHVRV